MATETGKTKTMNRHLNVCEQAARAGGEILLEMQGRITPRQKGPKDFVTEADFASQTKIREMLMSAFPEHRFVGEESMETENESPVSLSTSQSEFCWIVDPLDGTMNYVHQLPNYSVSVALRQGAEIVVGTVFDPVLNECFSAQRGGGATLNGEPIHASDCRQMDDALIAASLAAELPRSSPEVLRFIEVMHSSQAIRRLGSAALNLCYVASGRMDGYWATCVKIWDVAAGHLILQEAGGTLSGLNGGRFDLDDPRFVAAATPDLHQEFLSVLHKIPDSENR